MTNRSGAYPDGIVRSIGAIGFDLAWFGFVIHFTRPQVFVGHEVTVLRTASFGNGVFSGCGMFPVFCPLPYGRGTDPARSVTALPTRQWHSYSSTGITCEVIA
jgi:hypothetical protein